MTKKMQRLLARKAATVKSIREMLDSAEKEDRDLSAEEQQKYGDLKVEVKKLEEAIIQEEEISAMEKSLIPDGESTEENPALVDPNQRKADEKKWKSMGEFLTAVYRASTSRHNLDPRLVPPAASAGLQESVGSEGGFLVQTDFVQTLLARTYDNTVLLNGGAGYSGVSRIPLGANSNGTKIPAVNETSRADGSRWGGVQAYWQEEGGTKTDTKPDFRQISLQLKKLIGLCYATDELLQDATALEAVIALAFSEEFAFKIQDALVNGTGGGQPLGVMNAPCLVTVSKESGQTADTIVKANVDKMYARMWARGVSRAVWLVNQNCWPQLFSLVDAGSHSVWLPGAQYPNIAFAPQKQLHGRPVLAIEQCQTIGDKGDILFADFSEYVWIDKGNMQSATSIHVRFIYDESTFRFVFRCDGQPTWNSALTPAHGSDTQSPFVTLQARA